MTEVNQKLKEELELIETRLNEEAENKANKVALDALMGNDDFKRIILEGYVESEAKRLADALIMEENLNKAVRDDMIEQMMAVRHFKKYLHRIDITAVFADDNIEDLKRHRDNVKQNPEAYFGTEETEE